MNLIFLRHGEATDNVKKLLSDKEIYWSTFHIQKGNFEIFNNMYFGLLVCKKHIFLSYIICFNI